LTVCRLPDLASADISGVVQLPFVIVSGDLRPCVP